MARVSLGKSSKKRRSSSKTKDKNGGASNGSPSEDSLADGASEQENAKLRVELAKNQKVIDSQKATIQTLQVNNQKTKKELSHNMNDEMKNLMANCIKTKVFKKVKFLSCPKDENECMDQIVEHSGSPEHDDSTEEGRNSITAFKSTCGEHCVSELNKLCNCVQTSLKKKFDVWLDDNQGNMPNFQDLCQCAGRKLDLSVEENQKTALFHFDELVPKMTAHAKHCSDKTRHHEVVSKAKSDAKQPHLDVTAEMEALGSLMIENNFGRWSAEFH